MSRRERSEHVPRRRGLSELLGSESSALRRRLVSGGLVLVLALAALASLLAWRQYEDGRRRALVDLEARAVLAATVFDTYFAGQIASLQAIAASPPVVARNEPAMRSYFSRVEGAKPEPFTGGLGWIDSRGISRASSARRKTRHLDVSDRQYFRQVMRDGAPYVSAGLKARLNKQFVVVMAVPTRDRRGVRTGVLAGALRLHRSRTNSRAIDLGYEGLVVIDRAGQELTQADFPRPVNGSLLSTLRRGEGVLTQSRGLDGSGGRVVAYANSKAPRWTTVIDRPQSAVFAAPRRALVVELVSIAAATFILLGLMGWAVVRSGRAAKAMRADARRWEELTQSLGDVLVPADVRRVLSRTLEQSFPGCAVVVSLTADERSLEEEPLLSVVDATPVGDVLVLANRKALQQRLGELELDLPPDGIGSLLAAPLRTPDGARRGAVAVVSAAEDAFDDRSRALLATHVEEAGRALARTSIYQHEHDVAVALQQSLLPPALPLVDGMSFAPRYVAGGAGLSVGGDWYDVLQRPDGIVHLTVGDVAGRGIEAAATMARVRHAFRAYAYEYASPAQIVERLGRHVPVESMATVVCMAVDPYAGRLAYASAGHPPPLLVDADGGGARELAVVTTTPLGWDTKEPPVDTYVALAPGAVLVAYTDGLVERRGAPIDVGIARISSVLARSAALGAPRIVRELVAEAAGGAGSEDDDMAVLVSVFVGHPSAMEIEIPARTDVLPGLRRRVGAWLEARGPNEAARADLVLALSEACNNAIEHAYADSSGSIRLALSHRDERLLVTVADHGAWRDPYPDPSRGRGMLIMRGLMDSVDVRPGPGGTTVVMQLELGRDRASSRVRAAASEASPVA